MSLICGNTGAPVGKNCEDCMVNCRSYRDWESMNKSEQMAFRGTITKLPRDLDPNEMIRKRMYEKYSVCPFCGEEKKHILLSGNDGVEKYSSETWYGKQKHWWHIWEEPHHWRIDHWACWTCGAEWKSEAYPTDIELEGIGE